MSTLRRAIVLAVLYLLAARYSTVLHDVVGGGPAFWPGAGLTVTALMISPRRAWPALLAAVAVAELGNDLFLGFGLVPSLWWAGANTLEPLVTAWLIERWRADRFTTVVGVARFVGAAFLGPVVGGLLGAVGTGSTVNGVPYMVTVGQWVVGDGLGILTVVPLGLVVVGWIPVGRLRSTEAVAAMLVVVATSVLVFSTDARADGLTLDYLVLLPMVWAAVRIQVPGVALSLFLTAQIANALNAWGRGPFATSELTGIQGSVQLQAFLATAGITVLLLASRTAESARFHDLATARHHLIAAVSHELRTPLTPIVGFSELLLRRGAALDPDLRRGLEVINRNGHHLTELVDDLLQVSRGRRGTVPVHPEVVDVTTVLQELQLARQGDVIEIVSGPEDGTAWVDRTHLIQIVTNLVDNAFRHGRPPVSMVVLREGGQLLLQVSDQGDGVPVWFLPELFEEFAQATSGDRRPSLGLGLGLPIARSLALANGGDLRYVPPPHGATFELRLPGRATDVSPVGPGAPSGSRSSVP